MSRQTQQPDQWIVVDDCDPAQETDARMEVYRPEPRWQHGDMTLSRNMLEAFEHVRGDRVLVIEDDEWYRADYIERMSELLDSADLVGETRAYYYHLHRGWCRSRIDTHASACRTGFRASLLEEARRQAADTHYWDVPFWHTARCRKSLVRDMVWSVGMTGMPGRFGASVRWNWTRQYTADSGRRKLWELIGADAAHYAKY